MKIAICDDDITLNNNLYQFMVETYRDIDMCIDQYHFGEEFLSKISASSVIIDSIFPLFKKVKKY